MAEKYDPNVHHRRSVRLAGYDYSQEGWYFITICTQDRRCMFGAIIGDRMQLNAAGLMVESWGRKLTDKFPVIQTDESIVMPNHFHGIINVGAAPCGRPDIDESDERSGQPHRVAPTLADLVNWFKTMTTNQYIHGVKREDWQPFDKKLWQRNYYEHIIRNEEELNRFRQYISDNPANWQTDEENPGATP
ncbi:MAG: transposase [Planctomycetota bacterium]